MSDWTVKRDAFWAKVASLWSSLETRLEKLFTAGATAVANSIEQQAPKIKGDVEDFLDKAAHDAVTTANAKAAADPTIKGQDKMSIALEVFWGILKTVGLKLAENESRLILENALVALKLVL